MLAITDYFQKVFSERSHNKSFCSSVFCPLFEGVTDGLKLEGIGRFHCNQLAVAFINFSKFFAKRFISKFVQWGNSKSSFCSGSVALKFLFTLSIFLKHFF